MRKINTVLVFAMVLLVLACVSGSKVQRNAAETQKLVAEYLQSAQKLEKKGEPVKALEQYKLALTVDPKHLEAAKSRARLEKKLNSMAELFYRKGMRLYRQGRYQLAKKEFLKTLHYRPDHPGATKILAYRTPAPDQKFIEHVIQPGESISMIAKRYYGDYRKYHIIAEFNGIQDATKVTPGKKIKIPILDEMAAPGQPAAPSAKTSASLPSAAEKPIKSDAYVVHILGQGESLSILAKRYYGDYHHYKIIADFNGLKDATRVRTGQQIKVPRVKGLPFNEPKAAGSKETAATAPMPTTVPPPEGAIKKSAPPSPEPEPVEADEADVQVLAYRDMGVELYNEGRYEDTIFELNKVITAFPEEPQAVEYLAKAHFARGKERFNQKKYAAASDDFQQALSFNPQCAPCRQYIRKAEAAPMIDLREEGISQFNAKNYNGAISSLKQVVDGLPADNQARDYLAKSYYEQALSDYNRGAFLAAKKGFETVLEYDTDCKKCQVYIDDSRDTYLDTHYNKGIIYFGKQQLPEAISEWTLVKDMDPRYKDVDTNLRKAKSLLKKLERIKKSNQ